MKRSIKDLVKSYQQTSKPRAGTRSGSGSSAGGLGRYGRQWRRVLREYPYPLSTRTRESTVTVRRSISEGEEPVALVANKPPHFYNLNTTLFQ